MWAEQRTFQLGVHMTRGAIEPLDAARPMTDILATGLAALLAPAKREFADEHGKVPNDRLALVALGAAGRREFETGAPLELLFVYDHDALPSTAVLTAEEWHEQLVQRLLRLFGEMSPDGILYEAVAPYRADGNRNAWSMGALAERFDDPRPADLRMLTHARVIAADGSLGEDFEALRRTVLAREHDLGAVASDIADVRRRFVLAADTADIWDVARLRGGPADLELAAESLRLAGAVPEDGVHGLRATFEHAGRGELVDPAVADELARHAAFWQNLSGFLRMTSTGPFDPNATTPEHRETIAELAGTADFDALPGMIAETAARTAKQLDDIFARFGSVSP